MARSPLRPQLARPVSGHEPDLHRSAAGYAAGPSAGPSPVRPQRAGQRVCDSRPKDFRT